MNPDAWKSYSGDFNSMTDQEVEQETNQALDRIAEDEEWLEAVQSWEAAGRPRNGVGS